MSEAWFWEGNIVKAVSTYLQAEGWSKPSIANTESREAGVDIATMKDGKLLLVEVKGYPSKLYQRGKNKGLLKPTNPSTQARHWYGEVLLSAILWQDRFSYANPEIAIAFPDFPTYTKLVNRTRHALTRLDIYVYIVQETGAIKIIEPVVQ